MSWICQQILLNKTTVFGQIGPTDPPHNMSISNQSSCIIAKKKETVVSCHPLSWPVQCTLPPTYIIHLNVQRVCQAEKMIKKLVVFHLEET